MTQTRVFGSFEGQDIIEVTIRSEAGAEARIITWGAAVRDLVVPAKAGPQRVVLGFERLEDYVAHSPHFGANPGRFANRIGNAQRVETDAGVLPVIDLLGLFGDLTRSGRASGAPERREERT